MPDYPVGNGQFENLNPTPIAVHLQPASAPILTVREQIRLEMELSRRDQELYGNDDDDDDDFDFDDDPYYIDEPDYNDETESDSLSAEKEGQDAPTADEPTTEVAGATEGVSKKDDVS